jgi:hypothetical protein
MYVDYISIFGEGEGEKLVKSDRATGSAQCVVTVVHLVSFCALTPNNLCSAMLVYCIDSYSVMLLLKQQLQPPLPPPTQNSLQLYLWRMKKLVRRRHTHKVV